MLEVRAEEHLPLINRVIGQMGLKGDLAEEAFSESLVTIVIAANKYDPTKEIPLANWLAKNIRWGIQNWLARRRPEVALTAPFEAAKDSLAARIELNEVLVRIRELLTENERQIILATAYGFNGREISKALGISEGHVTRLRNKAKRKLKSND